MTDWLVKTLGDVCELSTGGTPSTGNKSYYDGGQIKWLRSGDVHQREIHDCDGRITEEGMRNANTRFLPLNSVLIALAGQGKTRGTVAMLRTKATCNQSVVSIAPVNTEKLLPEFIFWNLHMKYDEIRRMTGDDGNDRRGLNMRLIRSMTVPIAPLEEQKRIVALLDAATARVTELTACYEQARTHANNLFTSALRDALESNPDWPVKTLGEVCDFVRGVTYDKADARSEMKSGFIPLLRATNITEKGLLRDDFVFVPKNGVRADQKLISGDALITIASGSASVVGRSVLVEDPGEMTFGAFCGVLRPRSEILPRYLSHFMSSRSVRAAWSEAAQGTNINNLKRDDILQTECLLPPLEEQKKIVARLDSMRSKTSEMVVAYDAKLTAAKNLRQSILESAFAGDL